MSSSTNTNADDSFNQMTWEDITRQAGFSVTGTECHGQCITVHWPGTPGQRSGVAHRCETHPEFLYLTSPTARVESGLDTVSTKWEAWLGAFDGDAEAACRMAGITDPEYAKAASEASREERQAHRANKPVPARVEAALNEADLDDLGGDHGDDTGKDSGTRYRQALSYAEGRFTCRLAEGGRFVWGQVGSPLVSTGEDRVVGDIVTRAIPGSAVPRSVADQVLMSMRADAYDRVDAGEKLVKTDPRVLAAGDTTFIYTGESGSPVITISRDGYGVGQLPEGLAFTQSVGLPIPVSLTSKAKDAWRIFNHTNIPTDKRTLVLAWLITRWVNPDAPLPMLMMSGVAGSGKTTSAARFKALTDDWGGDANVQSLPRSTEGVNVHLDASATVLFDNLTSVPQPVSDLLCTVSTGGASVDRKLYSDTSLVITKIRRSVILTCVGIPSLRDDFRSRTISVIIPEITRRRRATEMDLAWESQAPMLRGALAALTVEVKRILARKEMVVTDRLADFEAILMAVSEVFEDKEAARSLAEAKKELAAQSYPDIIEFLREHPQRREGRFGKLLSQARVAARNEGWNTQSWPGNARGFSVAFRENRVALGEVYRIEETKDRKGHDSWVMTPHDSTLNRMGL